MKKLIAIFTLAIIALAPLAAQNLYCLDLEELQDSLYLDTPLGETIFEESAVTVSYDSYTMLGGSTVSEPAYVQSMSNTCCSGNMLEGQVVQVIGTIDFDFSNTNSAVSYVEMQYINTSNLEIGVTVNGEYYQASSLAGLPSVMAGDINFSYTTMNGTNNQAFGTLMFSGNGIEHISIGALDILIDNICYVPNELLDCEITNITTLQECVGDFNDDGIEDYLIFVDFDHELSLSNSFAVVGNGNDYGTFATAELPITLGPFGQNETINEFVITDEIGNCQAFIDFAAETCGTSNDCSLSNITLEYLNTDPNNYLYYSLDFNYQNTASSAFTLTLDGEVQGSYLYSTLPVGLVIPCDNDGIAQILITDNDNLDCSTSLLIDQFLCETEPCVPSDILVEVYNCSNNEFSIDFEFNINTPASDAFHAIVGGIQYGPFIYGNAFYTIDEIPFNATGEYTIELVDNLNPNCTESYSFNNNECITDCNIEFEWVEIGECVDGSFTMYFSAQTINLTANAFNVMVNGNELATLTELPNGQGQYMVDIPVGDGGPYEVLLTDIEISSCGDSWFIDEVECPISDCGVDIYNVTAFDCLGDIFFLSFDVSAVGPVASTFTLMIDGVNHGTYNYGEDQYYTDEILVGNGGPYQISIFDAESVDCADFLTIEAPCDQSGCELDIIDLEVSDCENGLFDIAYVLAASNPASNQFHIYLNGQFLINIPYNSTGSYDLFNLPYSGGSQVLTFQDSEFDDCATTYTIEELDCESNGQCMIDLQNIVSYACENGTFTLGIEVEATNNTSSFYTATINGESYNLSFNSNGQYLHNVPVNSSGVYELVLTDNDNPDCVYSTIIEVDCATGCNLEVFDFGVDYCNGTSMGISFSLDIESASGTGFHWLWDGEQFGTNVPYNLIAEYEFSNLPYSDGPHQLNVIDNENPDCFYTYLVDEIDCAQECWIEIFQTEVFECDGETFGLGFGFENFGTSDIFEVFINDTSYGIMEFNNQNFFELTGIAYEGPGPYTITIVDAMNPDCGSTFTFEIEDCGSDCAIIEANFNTTACDDNSFGIIVDFEVLNASNEFFDLYLGTNIIGFFPLDQLPLTISGIESDLASLNFSICINDDPNCCLEINIDNPCIEGDGFVWPGDANNDNTANIYDLLNIGIAYNAEGPARAVASTDWLAQDAELWGQEFPNGPNYVYADCDGDGLIAEADRAVILENYGLLHGNYFYPETEKGNENDPSLYVELPEPAEIQFGQTFSAPIIFGSDAIPAENVYGLAFRVKVNPDYIDINNVEINFQPSWLGVPGVNQLEIAQAVVDESAIDISITRIDQNNVTGFGALAEFIGIVDDIAGFAEVEVEITNVVAIMISQEVIPINTPTETLEISLDSNVEIFESNIRIYPNPTAGNLIIQNTGNDLIETVNIFSIDGKLLKTYNQANDISIHELPEGIYTVELVSQAGYRLFERIIKM